MTISASPPATAPGADPGAAPSTMTPAAARLERETIRADLKGAYWNDAHPAHAAANARVLELLSIEQGAAGVVAPVTAAQPGQPPAPAVQPGQPAPDPVIDHEQLVPQFLARDGGDDLEAPAADRALAVSWFKAAASDEYEVNAFLSRYSEITTPGAAPPDPAKSVEILRGLWRDKHDDKMAAAKRAVEKIGDGFADFLVLTGLGDDAVTIQRLAAIAERNGW